jgi:hypothetical protein
VHAVGQHSLFHATSLDTVADDLGFPHSQGRSATKARGSRICAKTGAVPNATHGADIAASIAHRLDYGGRIVEVDEPGYPPVVGRTPWSVPRPFVLDCRAALDLGYSPTTTYADAVKPVCGWLVATAGDGDWKQRFPVLARYPRDLFDYATEDEFFRRVGRTRR